MTAGPMVQLAPVPSPEERGVRSPFRAARLRRNLSVEDAATRAGLTPEEVTWLEEGRVYRFPSTDAALSASVVLAAALGVDLREARGLAGDAGLKLRRRLRGRLPVLLAAAAGAGALATALALPRHPPEQAAPAAAPAKRAKPLPAPWTIQVDVLNGSGDILRTRQVASRIGALAYTIRRVARADRFDYPQTAVYYERGGRASAIRLARQLGVVTKPLPGGTDPRRLLVVVGTARGPGQ
jgi:transcriptional regulator with XRE-family HTH domain